MARNLFHYANGNPRFPHPRGDGPVDEIMSMLSESISPPAWGWPAIGRHVTPNKRDFPTRVGMARGRVAIQDGLTRFPHPRGDGPPLGRVKQQVLPISPPAWGWPVRQRRMLMDMPDFPTRVGMARAVCRSPSFRPRFPHPRGDGPVSSSVSAGVIAISPPAWGWPASRRTMGGGPNDFPTRVGMARLKYQHKQPHTRFPHPRGDGPVGVDGVGKVLEISPPAWGWPALAVDPARREADFPTRVGMARKN